MATTAWRALAFPIADGELVVEVEHSGRLTRYDVLFKSQGISRHITSLPELARLFETANTSGDQLAHADPIGFGFLICVLSGRPNHVPPRESMWPELAKHFGLSRESGQPQLANGVFRFVAYSQYMPILRVSQIAVDLQTLQVTEQRLIETPWPPA